MPRQTYKANVTFTFSLDDERLKDVKELVTFRINEMLAALAYEDDVRIILLQECNVTEVK